MSLGRRAQSGMKTPSRETAARSAEAHAAETAKTTRLRALRLAKEAAERDVVPLAALPQRTNTAVRSRRANGTPSSTSPGGATPSSRANTVPDGHRGMRGHTTMRRGGRSPSRFPADRCVTAAARFPVYRQVGRRPSQVYVDEAMHPAASGLSERRLFDNVFWRTSVEIGDQIEERAGGFLLLTAAMACHPIQLSTPRTLEVATAFGHADAVLREDRKILDDLLAEGAVVEAETRRSRATLSRLPDAVFAEDHPLVVTIRPRGVEEDQPAPPLVYETDAATDKHPSGPR
jgi:hypothetical protein